MKYIILFIGALFVLGGCTDDKSGHVMDGEKLLIQKCSKCHNLDMPPKSYDHEIAPSMMAVTFHLKDFIKSDNPSEHEEKIVEFVKEYVMHPSAEKSLCDKASLESYGIMPSQKGKVSLDELDAIVHYMYMTYDNMKLLEIMKEKNRLAKLPLHKRVFEQQHCNYCHKEVQDGIAPSFKMIANRYTPKDRKMLIDSIKNGSKGKWKGKTLPMLPYGKKLDEKDIEGMADWILGLKQR